MVHVAHVSNIHHTKEARLKSGHSYTAQWAARGNHFTYNLHGVYFGNLFIDRLVTSKCLIVITLEKIKVVKNYKLYICGVFAESEV